jgi:hypothetical protein
MVRRDGDRMIEICAFGIAPHALPGQLEGAWDVAFHDAMLDLQNLREVKRGQFSPASNGSSTKL